MSDKPTLFTKGSLYTCAGEPRTDVADIRPIDYIMDWFKSRIGKAGVENKILLLYSETASGKSTALPPFVYKTFLHESRGRLICTQPRVLTAIKNVEQMVGQKEYSYFKLGTNIGWLTQGNKLRPKYGVLSATIGTLLMQLKTWTDQDIIDNYRFILIDEVHERDIPTDIVIYMLKNFYMRNNSNPNLPILALMSATFDPVPFAEYFGVSIDQNCIRVRGRTFGIESKWDWNEGRVLNNYISGAVQVVNKIHTENLKFDDPRQDILIFMPGALEIKSTRQGLEKLNAELYSGKKPGFVILALSGEVVAAGGEEIRLLDEDITKIKARVKVGDKQVLITPIRKVIIATTVAETGLTIDTLRYVIDCGWNKSSEFNPNFDVWGLVTKPASISAIKQRMGRAGRKFPGVFYPLYPEYIFKKLPELKFPQILVEDISPAALTIVYEQLKMKRLTGEKDPRFYLRDVNMLTIPAADTLRQMMQKLYVMGFIKYEFSDESESITSQSQALTSGAPTNYDLGCTLTPLGELVYPITGITLENIKMIMSSFAWDANPQDLVAIAAYISTDESFEVREGIKKVPIDWELIYTRGLPSYLTTRGTNVYRARLLITDSFIDGVILFQAIKRAMHENVNMIKWCEEVKINYTAMIKFIQMRDQIIEAFLTNNIEIYKEGDSFENVDEADFTSYIIKMKYCIYEGYRLNMLQYDEETRSYKSARGNIEVIMPKLFSDNETNRAQELKYGITEKVIPKFLLYHRLLMMYKAKKDLYVVSATFFSALDGFVHFDLNFL